MSSLGIPSSGSDHSSSELLLSHALLAGNKLDLIDVHYLSKRAGTPTIWKSPKGKANDLIYPTYYINVRKGVESDLELSTMKESFDIIKETRHSMWRSRAKGPKPAANAPPGQNLIATIYIPTAGSFTVSTAEEASPKAEEIMEKIATAAPLLWRALGRQLPVSPLHVEIVLLYRVEQALMEKFPEPVREYIENTNRYPRGTRLQVYGQYREGDIASLKPACQDLCQQVKSALDIQ